MAACLAASHPEQTCSWDTAYKVCANKHRDAPHPCMHTRFVYGGEYAGEEGMVFAAKNDGDVDVPVNITEDVRIQGQRFEAEGPKQEHVLMAATIILVIGFLMCWVFRQYYVRKSRQRGDSVEQHIVLHEITQISRTSEASQAEQGSSTSSISDIHTKGLSDIIEQEHEQ